MRCSFRNLLIGWMVCCCALVYADDLTNKSNHHFETHVRPLLAEKCFKCHSEEKQKGNLRLDSLAGMLTGGDSGPAIVPGHPEESLLMEAVRYESYEMPPDGKLSDAEIEHLARWLQDGAPWPGSESGVVRSVPKEDPISEEDREFWSFQPLVSPPVPKTPEAGWSRNEIDQFIFRRLTESGLTPGEEADRRTLIRRLTFDLVGLPPTPEEIDAFVNDPSPDAVERLVDRLLNSPQYGEHWASFWLDLVRYAESDGFRKDDFRPEAWRYRDYVINAFNEDLPYDRFVMEQLAGDEVAPDEPEALVATGFLRHGIYEYNQRDACRQWQDMLNDITDTVGDVFLGVGMGCARCHDHKFDPILQKDYYRLQAFFANISFQDNVPLASTEEIKAFEQQQRVWEEATKEIRQQLHKIEGEWLQKLQDEAVSRFPEDLQKIWEKPEEERDSLEKQLAYLIKLQVIENQQNMLASKLSKEEREKRNALLKELAEYDHLKPEPLPLARTVKDLGVEAPPTFIVGKPRLGAVDPGFLTIFDAGPATLVSLEEPLQTTGRRTTLARWLTRPNHPLVTRVIVNRIWKEHFGTGIVRTASDFGHLGEEPSHPELLDWLAVQFVENDWSLKWLHRQIVRSATYRQCSTPRDLEAERLDPDNRLLWRFPTRRLKAEQIRDAMLAVTSELDLSRGGPSEDSLASRRRSIYHKVLRNTPDPILVAFDFPDRILSCSDRNITTSSTQSLLLINGKWTLQRAQALASRLENESDDSSERLRRAFLLTFGREPKKEEAQRFQSALHPKTEDIEPLNWADLCHVLLNSSEFMYVD